LTAAWPSSIQRDAFSSVVGFRCIALESVPDPVLFLSPIGGAAGAGSCLSPFPPLTGLSSPAIIFLHKPPPFFFLSGTRPLEQIGVLPFSFSLLSCAGIVL